MDRSPSSLVSPEHATRRRQHVALSADVSHAVTKPPTTELPFWLNGLALTLTLDEAGLVFTSTTSGAEALQFSYFDVNSWHAGEEDGVKTGADRPRPVSTTAQRGSTTNSSWAALGFPPLVLSVHPSPMVGGRGAAETAAASGDAIRTDDESGAIELTFDAHGEETAATACEAIDGAVWRTSLSRLSRLSLSIAHSRTPHTHTHSHSMSPLPPLPPLPPSHLTLLSPRYTITQLTSCGSFITTTIRRMLGLLLQSAVLRASRPLSRVPPRVSKASAMLSAMKRMMQCARRGMDVDERRVSR